MCKIQKIIHINTNLRMFNFGYCENVLRITAVGGDDWRTVKYFSVVFDAYIFVYEVTMELESVCSLFHSLNMFGCITVCPYDSNPYDLMWKFVNLGC